MSKKFLFTATTLAAAAATAPVAFGFAEVARGKLVANASIRAVYDSNVFSNSSEQEDFSAEFVPELAFRRKVGLISTDAKVGLKAMSFNDSTDQNSIDPYADAAFRLDRADKGSSSISLRYARMTEANETLNDRVTSDEFSGTGNVDYYYSEKTGIRGNASYRLSDMSTAGYNDVSSYSLGGGILYRYSQKLVADATYSYSPEEASNLNGASDPSSKNHRFQLGLDGQLTPKLSGRVAAGYAYREFDQGGDNEGAMLLQSSLNWAAAEKTSVNLTASNDFDTTSAAESALGFNVSLGVNQGLTEKISLGGNVGYQDSEYTAFPGPVTRTVQAYVFGASLGYKINDIANLSFALSHRVSDSNVVSAVYDRTTVSLGLNLTY